MPLVDFRGRGTPDHNQHSLRFLFHMAVNLEDLEDVSGRKPGFLDSLVPDKEQGGRSAVV
jgi:hypothetical protein